MTCSPRSTPSSPTIGKRSSRPRLTSLDPAAAARRRDARRLEARLQQHAEQDDRRVDKSDKENRSAIQPRPHHRQRTTTAIVDVVPGSPADKAGIGPNMKLLGVNGRKFDEDLLKDAIAATPTTKGVELLLENASYFITEKLDYDGGPRFPHLERVEETPDILDKILAPRANRRRKIGRKSAAFSCGRITMDVIAAYSIAA